MKPGIRTTEFWSMLGANLVGLLALTGVIEPHQVEPTVTAITQVAGAVLMGLATYGYNRARGDAKSGS